MTIGRHPTTDYTRSVAKQGNNIGKERECVVTKGPVAWMECRPMNFATSCPHT
eukprot:gene7127-9610_t